MQWFNKPLAKRTFAHTWFLYPIAILLSVGIWVLAFEAFHIPTDYEKISLFFGADIHDLSFTERLQEKYDVEKVRAIDAFGEHPASPGYYTKLNIYLNNTDLLILPEKTLDEFDAENGIHLFFAEIDDKTMETYGVSDYEPYLSEEKTYGLKLKEAGKDCWLSPYMGFDEEQDYYLTLSVTSKNLGALSEEGNENNDNGLTMMSHLLGGIA